MPPKEKLEIVKDHGEAAQILKLMAVKSGLKNEETEALILFLLCRKVKKQKN